MKGSGPDCLYVARLFPGDFMHTDVLTVAHLHRFSIYIPWILFFFWKAFSEINLPHLGGTISETSFVTLVCIFTPLK